ncbi:MAG: EutN/CcmL family microcompartment protein [Clostridia bacterium]|nr:EutN/CcmL family microcompartment protein [Clostridia bacterium]
MILAQVKGSVVSTSKNEKLVGYKFMIVQPIENDKLIDKYFIAVDSVGAGIGEKVLVSVGSAARLALSNPESPVDAAIVGIVDEKQGNI